MACEATFLSFGCTPHRQDTINTLLKRIAGSASGGGGGGGGSANMSGSGSPVGVVTPTAINIEYFDTFNAAWYWSTGLTNLDWQQE